MSRFGSVSLREQVYQQRRTRRRVRRFAASARVRCRSLSLGLQRAVVDFGADSSFAAAVAKVREHYGIEVSVSAARSTTQAHGRAMHLESEVGVRLPGAGVRELVCRD